MPDCDLHLLVVEDDDGLAGLIRTAAADEGGAVTCVRSPAEARDALGREPFDVALVDLGLGAESGFDVLRLVNASYPDTSVVVMSADASITAAIRSYEMAAFAYLQKPFDLDDMLATVRRAAEHRRMTLNNRRLLWELQTINDVADGIAHSLDLEDVLAGALDRLCRALEVPNAAIRLEDERTGRFERAAVIGPLDILRTWSCYGGPIARPSDAVIESGRPVVIDDIAALVAPDVAASLTVRSAISVPMIAGDEMIGTLTLAHTRPRRFSAADQRLLTTIASQIGGCVQSARLHGAVLRGKREWEQTFDAIGDPIAVYDAAGRLLRGNAALAALLGCTIPELSGRTCEEVGLCGADTTASVLDPAGGGPRREEVTRADGQIFSVTTFPMGGAGDGAIVQVAKNVTQEIVRARQMKTLSGELAVANRRSTAALVQLKTTQAQLVQAEKLSAIGQLVAGVAHELNNPLTSVIGYAQLLEEEVRGAGVAALDPAALAQDLRRIAEESERAARIVRNLLAFARRQSAVRALHDAADLMERTLMLREYSLRSSGVELVREFASGLPPVLVDANQLQQAFLNLVLNAEQAMRDRTVRRLRIGARYDARAAAVELYVSDTGHGIDPAHLHRIFDPFFTTRDVGEGTGLGLSICYGIIRDHGGQIVVDSRAEEGATFSILLPARGEPAPPDPVLMACTDGGDHDAVAAALQAWGFDVTIVGSAAAALQQYRSERFGRLFIEGRLIRADLAGWREARLEDRRHTPLVVMGREEDRDVEQFEHEQAVAILTPPFSLGAVRAAARAAAEERL